MSKTKAWQGFFARLITVCIAGSFLVMGMTAAPAAAQAPPNGAWFTRKPLPTPRQEVPNAVLHGKVYVPGGFAAGGTGSNVVEVFDPITNTWAGAAPLPLALHHLACAAVQNNLYVLGGYTGNTFSATARVFEYDPALERWSEKMPLPEARGAAVAAVFDEKIFVIGGVNSSGAVVRTNQMYDPASNGWTTLSPMPTAREHLAAAVIDTLIYVIGGRDFSRAGNYSVLEAYDPAHDEWLALRNMPTPRGGLAAAALHGRLYVFGGEIPTVFEEAEEYDPQTGLWRNMTPMPTPRHGMGAATIGDTIFIIGGATVAGFGVSAVNSGFTPDSSAVVEDEIRIPQTFSLEQNYPNPFSAATIIRFNLPTTIRTTLKIFDMFGREMATLMEGRIAAGTHEVAWNASSLPTGIYFLRLQAGRASQTRKLAVVR